MAPLPVRKISDFPVPVTPSGMTVTQTEVTLNAGQSALLIAANPLRKYLQWMVIGANPATIAVGTGAAVVGQGMNYNGSPGAGFQGSGQTWAGPTCSLDAWSAISTLGTTIAVWEGQ